MDLGIYNKQNITKRDRSEIEILLESLNKNKRRTKSQPVQQTTMFAPVARSGDAVTFELSQEAKIAMLDDYIHTTLSKGEPLEGVTKEEFNEYYYRRTGNHMFGKELDDSYRLAVKGYNNEAAERRWRYDPNYKVPPQLWDTDEVTADRDAAIEKYKTGAELEPWEKHIMNTFINGGVGCEVIGAAKHTREQNIMQATLANMLSDAGIELAPDEELTFSVWGVYVEVSGANDEETNRRVQELFTDRAGNKAKYGEELVDGSRMSRFYYDVNKDKLYESGFTGSWLKTAVRTLDDEGSGVTIFDLSLDEDGNTVGLPEELDSFIKENAKGKIFDPIGVWGPERQTIIKARTLKEAFRSAVETVANGEYEKYRNMKCLLTYKNGILETK